MACGIPNTSSGGFEIFAFYRLPIEMRRQAFLRSYTDGTYDRLTSNAL